MPPLPTVLMTDVVRSSHQGESHGGAYLVDLAAGTFDKVLDWNDIDIDWEGRGEGRGLRGIVFHHDEIFIAASDELCVFDRSFKLVRSYRNPYLRHIHETFLEGDRLFVVSTSFNAVLEFDITSEQFVSGVWLDASEPKPGPAGAKSLTLTPRPFDPNSTAGPPRGDKLHFNMVWRDAGKTLVSGVRLPMMVAIDGARLVPFARIPLWTHNCHPLADGMLFNSTADDAIVLADRNGHPRRRFQIPTYDPSELEHADLPEDYARQGFGRGLCVTDDGVIVGGSSPSTVTAYDLRTGEPLASVRMTRDVRNCPHGLEVWPG